MNKQVIQACANVILLKFDIFVIAKKSKMDIRVFLVKGEHMHDIK